MGEPSTQNQQKQALEEILRLVPPLPAPSGQASTWQVVKSRELDLRKLY